MQTLIILREEFICLFIILYLLVNNTIYGSKQHRRAFLPMAVFAAGHVIFDIASVYTVNHMDSVPDTLNYVCHLGFYLSGALFSIEFFHYVFAMVYPNRAKISPLSETYAYCVFSLIYLAVFFFIPIRYTKGDGTFYSDGPAAAAAFAIPFFFFTVTTILLIVKRRRLDRHVVAALLPMLSALFAAEIAEIFWTEILITGGVLTLVAVGVYFSLENPRLFKALERAEASDRAKSYFLASTSHEIRTPLNAVIGFAELLQKDIPDAETQRDYLKGISDSGKALLDMVNDVLDLSKLEAGQMVFTPVETDVEDLAREIGAIFRQQRQAKGLEAVYDVEVKPLVALDKLRLRQILFNLMGNALKFTRAGTLTLRMHFQEDTPQEGTLVFHVIDTGAGIAEEDRERIFSPFIQSKAMRGTHAANQGTGLGLAIVLRMVRRMGGEIVLKSELGKGSDFMVSLPHLKYTGRLCVNTPVPKAGISETTLNTRILLVDDVALNLKVTEAMCRKLGVTSVHTAQSGTEALAALSHYEFDLILTDLWMPDMNGAELVGEIRKIPNRQNIPVFALTADIEVSTNFPKAIFSGILLKPITLDSLCKAIKSVSEGGTKEN